MAVCRRKIDEPPFIIVVRFDISTQIFYFRMGNGYDK